MAATSMPSRPRATATPSSRTVSPRSLRAANPHMAVVRLFASAREAAGLSVDRIDGTTVGEVLDEARHRYGEQFAAVLTHSRVWVNGQPADVRATLREADVVAVLPPVSGGSDPALAEFSSSTQVRARLPLEEPLPFTKPGSDRSPSGWFRPP